MIITFESKDSRKILWYDYLNYEASERNASCIFNITYKESEKDKDNFLE